MPRGVPNKPREPKQATTNKATIGDQQRHKLKELRDIYLKAKGEVEHWNGACHPNSTKMKELLAALHKAQAELLSAQEKFGLFVYDAEQQPVLNAPDITPEGAVELDWAPGEVPPTAGRARSDENVPRLEVKVGA